MIIPPSPMDLTTVAACQSWGSFSGTNTANLQACLTAASIYFLRATGRGPRNWQNATSNPFNQPTTYREVYDGMSGQKLFLRNFPINSVSSLTVNGVAVPASAGPGLPGYVIDDTGRALAIVGGGGGASPDSFWYVGRYGNGYTSGYGAGRTLCAFGGGPQSVNVTYVAGFAPTIIENEIYSIPPAWAANTLYQSGYQLSDGTYLQTCITSGTSGALAPTWNPNGNQIKNQQTKDGPTLVWSCTGIANPPNTVIVSSERTVLGDDGVIGPAGMVFTKVPLPPSQGQYTLIQPGTYLFNPADSGTASLFQISYTAAGTPADIILAIMQLVSLNYKRRDWIGQRSVAMKDVGSTSYTLATDPNIVDCIRNYTRTSMAS